MKMDCLLAGVGGQGTVLASRIIAQTAMENGVPAHTSETIGMAQRGGSVVSHVRIGQRMSAPSIPHAHSDLIIGFEPAEVLRNLAYLRPYGAILVNSNPVIPVTASLGMEYDVEAIIEYLKEHVANAIFVDGDKLCQKAGSGKVLNVIMLGIAVKEGLLPFSKEQIMQTLENNLPAKFLELNRRAFEIGYTEQSV